MEEDNKILIDSIKYNFLRGVYTIKYTVQLSREDGYPIMKTVEVDFSREFVELTAMFEPIKKFIKKWEI